MARQTAQETIPRKPTLKLALLGGIKFLVIEASWIQISGERY